MHIKTTKHRMIKSLISTSISATFLVTAGLSSMSVLANDYKHVAVAPEQMTDQKLADASSKGLFSHSTMLPIYTKAMISTIPTTKGAKSSATQHFEQKIWLDGPMNSPIVLLTPDAQSWFIHITDPNGKVVLDELATSAQVLPVDAVAIGSQSFSGKSFNLQDPTPGQWIVKLTHQGQLLNTTQGAGKSPTLTKTDQTIAAYLLHKGDEQFQAFSYLDNNFTTLNNDINIVAQMVNAGTDRSDRSVMVHKEAVLGTIDRAVATIKSPSGRHFTIALNDEGIKGDKVAGDGQFGAQIPTDEVGDYTSQIQIQGSYPDGKRYSRTTTDVYPIAPVSFAFSDAAAQLKLVNKTSAVLSVPVKHFDSSENVYLAAEVWGTNENGQPQSAAWVGGIVTPTDGKKLTQVELAFDTRWLSRENLHGPYTLRSLRLQTVNNNVPLAEKSILPIKAQSSLEQSLVSSAVVGQASSKEITTDMLMAKSPATSGSTKVDGKGTQGENGTAPTGGPALLLVHGYCSGQAWSTSNFYNSAEFKDYNKSITHDTFAQRVKNFGASYSSYGIVAHSQGGAAALQLYTKYYSGLDNATGGRLIQSVGTPYQGTALAGNLAAIGEVFGAGCGTNTDLTYSGASNWLSTIPTWARNQVDYYTTSFTTNWYSYDYCHLATDLFLDDPEDGTTEKWSGQLSGGVNKGHKTGWCHTSGMRDPAQTKDNSRNSVMSSNAAR